jgi:hypothetical protein
MLFADIASVLLRARKPASLNDLCALARSGTGEDRAPSKPLSVSPVLRVMRFPPYGVPCWAPEMRWATLAKEVKLAMVASALQRAHIPSRGGKWPSNQ